MLPYCRMMAIGIALCVLMLGVLGQAQSPAQNPAAAAKPVSEKAGPKSDAAPTASPTSVAPAPVSGPAAPTSSSTASAISDIIVDVNEVIVPVTVTDSKGRFISNLEKKDFEVYDEGVKLEIGFFSRERNQPIVAGILLDLSNSSRTQWKNFQEATTELALTLLPGKEKYSGYLIGYGNKAELMIDTTSDSEPFVSKLRDLKPGGGAALFDAIYMACTTRSLVKGEPFEPRRVIVVIGDGSDNSSNKTLDQVLELAQKNLVTIYGISTTSYGFISEGDANLRRLAEETGGRVEYPLQNVYKNVQGFLSRPSDEGNLAFKVGTGGFTAAISGAIIDTIANVAGEITTQYILRYIPGSAESPEKINEKNAGKVFRQLNVKVALPDVTVRARKGYYPSKP